MYRSNNRLGLSLRRHPQLYPAQCQNGCQAARLPAYVHSMDIPSSVLARRLPFCATTLTVMACYGAVNCQSDE
ncbi:unnamed protein product [Protopolystoma xenopodis]|uniref:Uncharacterized protein n=1 Tax=Protopolystoma xenopodis TaxID=117903 RepID=A0A3S5CIQ6_9PLAT|nr:unnamed protein product [Protopolystoma xenopodis]